jgi:hypothetical protein
MNPDGSDQTNLTNDPAFDYLSAGYLTARGSPLPEF